MRIHLHILALAAIIMAGCGRERAREDNPGSGVRLMLSGGVFSTRVIDEDNPASEQVINDITVFFTEPDGNTITHRFVDSGFTSVDDYKVVTIPLEPSELAVRDIYVVANRGGVDLGSVATITDFRRITTRTVSKSDYLDPARGFCMYGKTAAFDFTAGGTAVVNVERTVAKMRITLTFPGAPDLSTDNTYLFGSLAPYTYISEDARGLIIPLDEYFNMAAELELEPDGTGAYRAVNYVYEGSKAPVMYIYTHINGSFEAQSFSANLPIPERNYMYDLDVRVYEDTDAATRSAGASYRLETTVTVRDGRGNIVETVEY